MSILLKSSLSDEDIVIQLTGDLDEKQKFPEIKMRVSQRVIFDCEGLNHLSSFAAQTWAVWMKDKDNRQQFVFRNVPPRVVDMFSLVENYLPLEATIESFYVPYECENCGFEEWQLARRGREYLEEHENKSAILRLPDEINCPNCKNGMKLGVWSHKFLRFLQKRSAK